MRQERGGDGGAGFQALIAGSARPAERDGERVERAGGRGERGGEPAERSGEPAERGAVGIERAGGRGERGGEGNAFAVESAETDELRALFDGRSGHPVGSPSEQPARPPLELIDATGVTGDSASTGPASAPERDGDDGDSDDSSESALTAAELDALFERPARPRVRMGVGAAIVLALVALAVGLIVAALQPSPAALVGGESDALEGELGDPVGGAPAKRDGAPDAAGAGGPGGAGGGASAEGASAAGGGGGGGDGAGGAGGAGGSAAALLVHVVGAVADPGVVTLAPGSRVVDAINAAGGFIAEADRAAVNLARAVVDGEQLWVPRVGEQPPGGAPPGGTNADANAGASAAGGVGAAGGGTGADGGAPGGAGGLVNLNTATQAELETLPRIGPALAQRIIEYREQHGGFATVDELKNVSGIGDKTFDALAPLVTV